MSDTVVLSIRVPAKTKAKFEKLAELSGHSKSWHAAEALDSYVEHTMPIVKSLLKAREDARKGLGVSLDQMKAETKAIIAEAKAKQKRRA
jgi:predicted transcriptional regulator